MHLSGRLAFNVSTHVGASQLCVRLRCSSGAICPSVRRVVLHKECVHQGGRLLWVLQHHAVPAVGSGGGAEAAAALTGAAERPAGLSTAPVCGVASQPCTPRSMRSCPTCGSGRQGSLQRMSSRGGTSCRRRRPAHELEGADLLGSLLSSSNFCSHPQARVLTSARTSTQAQRQRGTRRRKRPPAAQSSPDLLHLGGRSSSMARPSQGGAAATAALPSLQQALALQWARTDT